jgi:hypothetical protein
LLLVCGLTMSTDSKRDPPEPPFPPKKSREFEICPLIYEQSYSPGWQACGYLCKFKGPQLLVVPTPPGCEDPALF